MSWVVRALVGVGGASFQGVPERFSLRPLSSAQWGGTCVHSRLVYGNIVYG